MKIVDLTRRTWRPGQVQLVLVAFAAVYVLTLLLRSPSVLTALTWDSDSASGFDVAESLALREDNGPVKLTTSGQFVSLWFGLLTARLPLHRELWMAAPWLAYVGTCALVALSVKRIATRSAAVLTFVLLLAASPRVLFLTARGVTHTPTYLGCAVLGCYVVWTFGPRRSGRVTTAASLFTAVVVGVLVASDPLLVATGVAGLVAALVALAVVVPERRSTAAVALIVLVGAAVTSVGVTLAMRQAGFTALPVTGGLAPLNDLDDHASWLARGLLRLGNGAGPNVIDPLGGGQFLVSAYLVIPGLVAAGLVAVRTAERAVARRRDTGPVDPALLAHVLFWTASAVAAAGAFLVSDRAANGNDQYFVVVLFSVAALLPLAIVRGDGSGRAVAVLAVSAFTLASTVGVVSGDVERQSGAAVTRDGDRLITLLRARGLEKGYGGYFDASSVTWRSRYAVQVRPVLECGNPDGADLCPFFLMRVASWYEPASGPTYLVVNPTGSFVTREPKGLGPPVERVSVGVLTLLVYPYDIASRFGPAPT